MKPLLLATVAILATSLPAQVHCSFHYSDVTCGPLLRGAVHARDNHTFVLTYATTHAPASTHGVLAFGVHGARIRLDSGCLLLVQPLVLVPYAANDKGEAHLSFTVARLVRGQILAQAAFKSHGLRTSNSATLTCR